MIMSQRMTAASAAPHHTGTHRRTKTGTDTGTSSTTISSSSRKHMRDKPCPLS